jgi:hypothetical protein
VGGDGRGRGCGNARTPGNGPCSGRGHGRLLTSTHEALSARAERAVLGALLLRADVYPDITYLDSAQFADRANAALFEALRTELAHEPD